MCAQRSVVRMKTRSILGYANYAQSRFGSGCANSQAILILRWTHMPDGMFPAATQRWNNVDSTPRHNVETTSIQPLINAESTFFFNAVCVSTSIQRQDVESTLFQRCVSAGFSDVVAQIARPLTDTYLTAIWNYIWSTFSTEKRSRTFGKVCGLPV